MGKEVFPIPVASTMSTPFMLCVEGSDQDDRMNVRRHKRTSQKFSFLPLMSTQCCIRSTNSHWTLLHRELVMESYRVHERQSVACALSGEELINLSDVLIICDLEVRNIRQQCWYRPLKNRSSLRMFHRSWKHMFWLKACTWLHE